LAGGLAEDRRAAGFAALTDLTGLGGLTVFGVGRLAREGMSAEGVCTALAGPLGGAPRAGVAGRVPPFPRRAAVRSGGPAVPRRVPAGSGGTEPLARACRLRRIPLFSAMA